MSKVSAGLFSLSLAVAVSAQEPIKFNVPGVSPSEPAKPATPAKSTPTAQPTQAAPTQAAPAAPAATGKKFSDLEIAEAYGWYLGAQMGLRQLEFSTAEVQALARGIVASVGNGQPAFNPQEMGPQLEEFLGKKNQVFMGKLRNEQLSEGAAFFTSLKQNKNVIELPSGLRYEITKTATGALPKAGQQVTIHYTGSLVDGRPFDSSVQRGQPVDMVLIPDQIIPGMIEGVQKIPVGGKGKLYIPPSLAYGDQGSQVIPPGATLVFEVEVLAAKDAPKDAAPVPAKK